MLRIEVWMYVAIDRCHRQSVLGLIQPMIAFIEKKVVFPTYM